MLESHLYEVGMRIGRSSRVTIRLVAGPNESMETCRLPRDSRTGPEPKRTGVVLLVLGLVLGERAAPPDRGTVLP